MSTGIIVFWVMGDVKVADMVKLWNQAGLPLELLPKDSPYTALRQTMDDLPARHNGVFARPRGVDGWIVYAEDEKKNHCKPLLSVVASTAKPSTLKHQRYSDADAVRRLAGEINNRFTDRFNTIFSKDMLAALADVAVTVAHGALLGDGVYYIPEAYVAQWRDIARTLREVSGAMFHECEVTDTEAGDAAISAAIVRQIDSSMRRIDSDALDLDQLKSKLINSQLRKKEKDRRAMLVGEIEEQLGVYDGIFRDRPAIQDGLTSLRAKLAATLLAEVEDNA